MKITYVYNSCFVVETEHYNIIFDYFRGDLPLAEDKKRLFVVTHAHADHFDPVIFHMASEDDLMLVSDDVETPKRAGILPLAPHESGTFRDIFYQTAGSTDQGISVYLEIDGQRILHAGDLNLWIWPEDSDEERVQMTEAFEREVRCFQGRQIDVAFFAVDGRLADDYIKGPLFFLETLHPKVFVPMHFREDFATIRSFGQRAGNPISRLWIPKTEYDSITL